MKINDDCSLNRLRWDRSFRARFANKTFYLQLISFGWFCLWHLPYNTQQFKIKTEHCGTEADIWFRRRNIFIFQRKEREKKTVQMEAAEKRNINGIASLMAISLTLLDSCQASFFFAVQMRGHYWSYNSTANDQMLRASSLHDKD